MLTDKLIRWANTGSGQPEVTKGSAKITSCVRDKIRLARKGFPGEPTFATRQKCRHIRNTRSREATEQEIPGGMEGVSQPEE